MQCVTFRKGRRPYKAITMIYLEFGNQSDSIILPWQTLPHKQTMYTVKIRPPISSVATEFHWGIPVCRLYSHALSFSHKMFRTTIQANHVKFVSPWMAKRISAIRKSNNYYIALIMTDGRDSHNIVQVRPYFAGARTTAESAM